MKALAKLMHALLRWMGYSLPYGLGKRGLRARIARPRQLRGRRNIFIGDDSFVHRGAQIQAIEHVGDQSFNPKVTVGSRVYIGQHVFVASINEVAIGNLCVLSDHVYISDSAHGLNPSKGPILDQPWESRGPIRIGDSTFIGYRAVIMPGVTLGKFCVVGANAVVTRSFPDFSMIIGAPAHLVKIFDTGSGEWMPVQKPGL